MFNFMDELFVPGRKHTEDERNRLELTREDAGSNDPGRGMIDLDSGSVVIRPPRADEPAPAVPTVPEPEGDTTEDE
ncbi:DUF6191 domain-containing protein [Actinacidiphila alni]|uniref:Uncharacterized protein n=1 Tax=Actinacidiphila alni TaxID=380248 RepID=A0A1I2ALD9_9ACTN|nr:DUF6191 domain-containing protein [Actinacidiphila alni]SFE44368.1 hypothetical protein SAMN05216251_103124 [Actinacidiphila alni]